MEKTTQYFIVSTSVSIILILCAFIYIVTRPKVQPITPRIEISLQETTKKDIVSTDLTKTPIQQI